MSAPGCQCESEQPETLDAELEAKINEWLKWDRNEATACEIKRLSENGEYERLRKILMNRLTFGTAGLRDIMGPGYAALNDLVIVQTGQGMLAHLKETEKEKLEKNGVVIGYDGRHNSKRFAELTAAIFLHANCPVHIFSKVVPTPFVPFTVNHYKAAAGIMVTASHNPKEYNGYKVYGPNGAQITSPTDKHIQAQILRNLEPRDTSWDVKVLKCDSALKGCACKKLHDPLQEIFDEYVRVVSAAPLKEHLNIAKSEGVVFTYTPMHGVGYPFIERMFRENGLKCVVVPEQKDPHPDFPTVKFPNPEEGKSCLDLAFKTAAQNNSKVIIANDPDADRLAAAEKLPNGEWKVFTGNELGALLGWWSFHTAQIRNEGPCSCLKNCYMIASTVSSMILKTMAHEEGFNFIETLTGFKWMGNKAYELMQEDKEVLFAFEEAIGFMCGTIVLDKDGVCAGFHLAVMCSYLHHHGLSLVQQLDEIYKEYGFHTCLNSYFICHDAEKIKRIFERIRNFKGANTYPTEIIGGKYKISGIRDLTTGYDDNQADKKAVLPVSKDSQMITFSFTNGLTATLRTSGTEPKIKYYTELRTSPQEQLDRKDVEHTLKEMVDGIIFEFLQPSENGLIPKSD